ncbi:fumarylacetoacetate hydrolase family protein [Methylocystis bryophila]|uniref:Fumarylacetoacetate hydrolase n=1 Tax=Methylocystis bryophila TaxID=655015 RepID=A0A1W6MTR3_9HYPH|nr:fumarylacetoacetate hydrolase family protein [Methylocystis bryophila]ARN80955.1 fumarylacetoacetate hydrolase [Methylocystis bryophila]BDV36859.1 fumarylpyruvate hydrolase [Methylocystis bryophila]
MTEAEFLFSLPRPSVAVAGQSRRFPVRRIWCVGLNYAAHAREMGKDPAKERPFFFSKPADAVVESGSTIPYASMTGDLHYEIELVAALHSGGAEISRETALDHVFGYAAGIDLTRRDLQKRARDEGKPWDLAKGFDQSAPLGAIAPAAQVGHPRGGRIALAVNGAIRQQGDLSDMILDTAGIIAELSRYVRLAAGDLIFTGTPEGVGPLRPGDVAEGEIASIGPVRVQIAG